MSETDDVARGKRGFARREITLDDPHRVRLVTGDCDGTVDTGARKQDFAGWFRGIRPQRGESRPSRSRFTSLAGAAAVLLSISAPALAERPGKPALDPLLRAFAERRDEKAMQEIQSIEWDGVSYPNDSEQDNSYVYVLRGRLRLVGFGEVDVPVGVGADQTTRKANEGEASFEVRFSSVNDPAMRGPVQITMVKLYPSADHRAILERNLPGARVVVLADACARDPFGRLHRRALATYYRIDLPQAPTSVFALARPDPDGGNSGPGDTTFTFSLFTPGKDMTTSACTLHTLAP